jgi:DNA mismatch repair protein MutL
MQRIRLLSEKVANQIAAGEVVERPASIVKELVENAIDASSTRIKVEIEAGGRSLIRVTDDGFGMNRDDALLCLERHATSKIREATDLASVQTMGFRGEALPSISSISRFTLTTKERDSEDPDGTQIIINGGKIIKVHAGTGATGTTIEVRNVFYNLPARRKFLRTAETERSHIQHYLQLAALAHAHIGFTYVQDNRTLWQIPPATASQSASSDLDLLIQRYKALNNDATRMLRLEAEGNFSVHDTSPEPDPSSEQPIRVWGLIGAPGMSRSTRSDQHLFVNRRPIENRGLNRALIEGYHTSLMKARYPICCLFLEIDPRLVDVNVHPSKKEVKFRNEFGVRRFVADAIKQELLHYGQDGSVPRDATVSSGPLGNDQLDSSTAAPSLGVEAVDVVPAQQLDLSSQQSKPAGSTPSEKLEAHSSPPQQQVEHSPPIETNRVPEPESSSPPSDRDAHVVPTPLLQVPLRLIGVIGKLYVIYESDRGMVIMDQHAAHERILFEQMMKRMETGDAPSQRLLLPETLELSARDAQFLREQLDTFCRLGVGISEFGEHTFLLDALPPFAKVADAKQFTLGVIDQLKRSGESINKIRLGEDVIAKTVCRHAVKANDSLHDKELEKLLADLRNCVMPYTCPHGRPTLIELSCQELEKKFGRVQ